MNRRVLIYRVVLSLVGALSLLLALNAHLSDTINNFYFPNLPIRDGALLIRGFTVLAVILVIEAMAAFIPRALGWNQDV